MATRASELYEKGRQRIRRSGPLGAWAYKTLLSDGMRRERQAVTAGQKEFTRRGNQSAQAYRLRRAVHMLEKGLTMRPLRSTFAVDYIERAVHDFIDLQDAGTEFGTKELEWAGEVLRRYFAATSESQNEAIGRARTQFVNLAETLSESLLGPAVPLPSASVLDVSALETLARQRQSVRWFTSEPVPRETVDKALEIAAEAPTACNRQPYRFHVFDDPALARKVAAIPMGTAGYADSIGSIVVLVGDMSAFADDRDRHLVYIDGCLAAMSFILGLEAQGVSTCCINWPDLADRERAMAQALGLQRWERPIMLIAYGYADDTGLAPYSQKKPLNAVRVYNQGAGDVR
jgi:nitroreductase